MVTKNEVLQTMTSNPRDSLGSVDSEMCQLLFSDVDKLRTENKTSKQRLTSKEKELNEIKKQVKEFEGAVNEKDSQIKSLKEKASDDSCKIHLASYEAVKVSDLTPRAALRKMVDDLTRDCAHLHIALKESSSNRNGTRSSDESTGMIDIEDKLQRERERNEELTRQLAEEREKVDEKMSQKRQGGSGSKEEELRHYDERIKTLKKELKEERDRSDDLQSSISEDKSDKKQMAQVERQKLLRQISALQTTIAILEKKLKEAEEKIIKCERSEKVIKKQLLKSEEKLEEERSSQYSLEGRQKEMTMSWLKERDDLKKEVSDGRRAMETFEKEKSQSQKSIKKLEAQVQTEKKKVEDMESKIRHSKDDCRKLQIENVEMQVQIDDSKSSIVKMTKEKERMLTKQNKELESIKAERDDVTMRMETLEAELKMERLKRERMERDSAAGLKGKSSELGELKEKCLRLDSEKSNLTVEFDKIKKELGDKLLILERKFNNEKRAVEAIQEKYDLLEEELVIYKAQNPANSKGVNEDLDTLQKEHNTVLKELRALRETYNVKQDTWIKEKLDMQMQIQDIETRSKEIGGSSSERLKSIIEDKNIQLDTLKSEMDTIQDQLSYYRREYEEVRKKMEDLEKLLDIAEKRTSTNVDTKQYESTIKDLRTRFTSVEKTHKSEVTKLKIRYDTKVKALSEEVNTLTQHLTKYRSERDTYKEMLEGAQKNIADLKGSSSSSYRTSRADNATEAKAHLSEIHDMQSQITELEDKLADSRLEFTKAKNNIVDQKGNFEIQLSELQTKLNEYEEDRLLMGGGRRVSGLRTRLELNWQKEREEQQRLIQETATLAKDLRQTLYEVERERDMDRLESKRKIDQMKRTVNQDHHDTKSKVLELQRDLHELREAHAKLRQINEKLRREKDRTEVEREAMREKFLGTSREQLNQQTRMEVLLDEFKKIKDLAPLVLGEAIDSREGSLTNLPIEIKGRTREEFTDSLRKMTKITEEFRFTLGFGDERGRRTPSLRRTMSIESDDESLPSRSRSAGRGGTLKHQPRHQKSQLYRKSQSLDHQLAEEKGKIWVSTDRGSTSSIESSMTDEMKRTKNDMDKSFDRISTGSQTSDIDKTGDSKKKSLKSVFAKFGRSKSIEDSQTGESIVGMGLHAIAPGLTGSGSSIGSIESEKDKDSSVKGKLKTLFKKGSSNRSHSSERDGPSVKQVASNFEPENPSSSLNKSNLASSQSKIAPVMQRFQGGSQSLRMTKARSIGSFGRTS